MAVLVIAAVIWWNMPVRFLKGVDAGGISHIEVFNGNTGRGFDIDSSKDIAYIVSNIQSAELKRDKLSLGYSGTMFHLRFYDDRGRLADDFIINYYNTIRDDPFFYRNSTDSLCVDYLQALESALAAE